MPSPEQEDAPPGAAAKQILPWLVAVGFFMESLDTTILNTAVPVIARSLQEFCGTIREPMADRTKLVAAA